MSRLKGKDSDFISVVSDGYKYDETIAEKFEDSMSEWLETTAPSLASINSTREDIALKIFQKQNDRSWASLDRVLDQIEYEQRHRNAMQWACLGISTLLVGFSICGLCYITIAGVQEKYIYSGFVTVVLEMLGLFGIIFSFMFSNHLPETYDKIITLKATNDTAYDNFDKY